VTAPEILDIEARDVQLHDVLGEGQRVRAITWLTWSTTETVYMDVGTEDFVEAGPGIWAPQWHNDERLSFRFGETIRVIRGVPLRQPPTQVQSEAVGLANARRIHPESPSTNNQED
jgi:hypothetical protein